MKQLTVIDPVDYLDQINFDPAIVGRTMSYERIRMEALDLVVAAEAEVLYLQFSDVADELMRIRNRGGVR